jgi:LPS-assembly protein
VQEAETVLEAQQLEGRLEREVILKGDVDISRGDIQLSADRARYDLVEEEVHIIGNVWMKRPGEVYSGEELRFKLDTGEGYLLNPTYQLDYNNAQGQAERIDFASRDQARVIEGTYSTCEGPDPDWYLTAGTLDLDNARDIGTARGTVVYFKGVPILGSPYLSFPLSDERKSGLLPPTIGTTNNGGLEVTVPYYFNIAPNRDLTLYPKVISQRGLQLGAHGRYLGETYSGETRLEWLPGDQLLNEERGALSSVHVQQFTPRLRFSSNLNFATDDEYPNDFPNTLTEADKRLLPRELQLSYAGAYWSLLGRTSNYQVLQDPLSLIERPYARLPQIAFNAVQYNVAGFDWSMLADATRFWHPDRLDGDRMVFQPRLSYPVFRQGYFIKPSLSLHATHYSLERTTGQENIDRVLPTFSVDGGLIFERDATYFGDAATQTLEPRLFYVYTPYRYQENIPRFDTAALDFSFAELFSENRFSGHDRIADANQVTAAVTSRYLGPTGAEYMRLTVAQRYYVQSQEVTIDEPISEARSDILLAASGQLSPTMVVNTSLQYSEALEDVSRATYGLRWQPGPRRVLNVQYRRDVPNDLEQFDVSSQWPLAERWYGVGRVNYSLTDNEVAEGLLGFEYRADCWVFRMVGQRTPTATGVATTAFYFQLELNGLSRLGSDPLNALRDNIAGYQMVN